MGEEIVILEGKVKLDFTEEVNKVEKGLKDIEVSAKKTGGVINDAFDGGEIEKTTKKVGLLDKNIEELEKDLKDLTKARNQAFSTKEIRQYNSEIKATESQLAKLKNQQNQVATFAVKAGKLLAASFAGIGLAQFVTSSVRAFSTLDASLKELSAITGLSEKDLEKLEERAKSLSKTSTKSAADVLTAFKLIGSAKPELLDNVDALSELTQAAIVLSEASGLELPFAAEQLGNALNAMQLPASRSTELINLLAAASQKGAKEIPFVVNALTKFGGVASQAGLDVSESVAAVELLGKAIPQAEIVGNNLKGVLVSLQVEAQKDGREFISLKNELDRLAPKVDDITFLTKTFGKENILAIQTLISQREELGSLQNAIEGTNTAYEQQAEINDSARAKLLKFKNTVEALKVEFGELLVSVLLPIIRVLSNFITVLTATPKFIRENATAIKLLGVALIGLRLNTFVTGLTALSFRFASFARLAIAGGGAARTAAIGMRVFNAAVSANPLGFFITVLSTAAAAFLIFKKNTKIAKDELKEFGNEIDSISRDIGEKLYLALTENTGGFEGALENLKGKIKDLRKGELESLKLFFEEELSRALRTSANATDELDKQVADFEVNTLKDSIALLNTELDKYTEKSKGAGDATVNLDKTIKPVEGSLDFLNEKLAEARKLLSASNDKTFVQKTSKEIGELEDKVSDLNTMIDLFKLGISEEEFGLLINEAGYKIKELGDIFKNVEQADVAELVGKLLFSDVTNLEVQLDKKKDLIVEKIEDTIGEIKKEVLDEGGAFDRLLTGNRDVIGELFGFEPDSSPSEKASAIVDYIQNLSDQIFSVISSIQDSRERNELNALEEQYRQGVISAKKLEQAKAEIQNKYAEKRKKAAKAEATINFALAVTKTFAESGLIAGLVQLPILTAILAAQIKNINSQKVDVYHEGKRPSKNGRKQRDIRTKLGNKERFAVVHDDEYIPSIKASKKYSEPLDAIMDDNFFSNYTKVPNYNLSHSVTPAKSWLYDSAIRNIKNNKTTTQKVVFDTESLARKYDKYGRKLSSKADVTNMLLSEVVELYQKDNINV